MHKNGKKDQTTQKGKTQLRFAFHSSSLQDAWMSQQILCVCVEGPIRPWFLNDTSALPRIATVEVQRQHRSIPQYAIRFHQIV